MAENIIIEAKNITLNKDQKSSLFEGEVKVKVKELCERFPIYTSVI